MFKLILEKSTDVNAQNKFGETALHYAIKYQSKIALRELIKSKIVNFLIKDKNNCTVLHLASNWEDIPSDLFRIIEEKSGSQRQGSFSFFMSIVVIFNINQAELNLEVI